MKRFDLIPSKATSGIAAVFGQGIKNGYEADGWKNCKVSQLLNKLKEKLTAFENMEDLDDDDLCNIDKVAAYAMMIKDTISTKPQNDDRFNNFDELPRIALDVDDVVADFLGGFKAKTGLELNNYWAANYELGEELKKLANDEEFWVNLPVKNMPNFEPACYISSRSIPVEFTEKFIQKAGLPCAPVHHVPWNESKVEILKKEKIDVLVDD